MTHIDKDALLGWLRDFKAYGKEFTVIGNIHDNPELLEV